MVITLNSLNLSSVLSSFLTHLPRCFTTLLSPEGTHKPEPSLLSIQYSLDFLNVVLCSDCNLQVDSKSSLSETRRLDSRRWQSLRDGGIAVPEEHPFSFSCVVSSPPSAFPLLSTLVLTWVFPLPIFSLTNPRLFRILRR